MNVRFRIQDAGFRIKDSGYEILDTGYWIDFPNDNIVSIITN